MVKSVFAPLPKGFCLVLERLKYDLRQQGPHFGLWYEIYYYTTDMLTAKGLYWGAEIFIIIIINNLLRIYIGNTMLLSQ